MIGLSLVVSVLAPVWDVDPMAGALIEIGFQGGHGTAAGLSGTFASLGFESGKDLAVGIVTGLVLGTVILNWGVARGHMIKPEENRAGHEEERPERAEDQKPSAPGTRRDLALESMSFQLGLIAAAIGIGWLILEGLKMAEEAWLIPLGWPELIAHVPLFPVAMLGAVGIQIAAARVGLAARAIGARRCRR